MADDRDVLDAELAARMRDLAPFTPNVTAGVLAKYARIVSSASLGAVIGASAMPRTEVTKKIWAYIKKNKLQDAKNRRMINADDNLKDVFGGKKQVSMFEMTKLVSKHLK